MPALRVEEAQRAQHGDHENGCRDWQGMGGGGSLCAALAIFGLHIPVLADPNATDLLEAVSRNRVPRNNHWWTLDCDVDSARPAHQRNWGPADAGSMKSM